MQRYSDQVKAQVIAEWQAGASKKSLARNHDIPLSTVRNWTGEGIGAPRVTPETKDELDARVLSLASVGVGTLEAILLHARDKSWLEKQNAHDLGIFTGVVVDKLAAILSAYERGAELERERLAVSAGA